MLNCFTTIFAITTTPFHKYEKICIIACTPAMPEHTIAGAKTNHRPISLARKRQSFRNHIQGIRQFAPQKQLDSK